LKHQPKKRGRNGDCTGGEEEEKYEGGRDWEEGAWGKERAVGMVGDYGRIPMVGRKKMGGEGEEGRERSEAGVINSGERKEGGGRRYRR